MAVMSSARLFTPPISHPIAEDVVIVTSVDGSLKLTFLYGDTDGSSAMLFLSAEQAQDISRVVKNKETRSDR